MVLDLISLNFIKFSSSITNNNYATVVISKFKTVTGFVKPVFLKGKISSSVKNVMIIKCINILSNIIWVSIFLPLIKTSSFLSQFFFTISRKKLTMIRNIMNPKVNKNKITVSLYPPSR